MRKPNIRCRTLLTAIASITATQISTPVFAQSVTLQEIVVTAQKREEALGDVPISVNVVSVETLEAANINKIEDVTEFVPNMTMTETRVSTQMYVRGIGSGNNQGFEQSVGQYIDAIYYGRQQLIRAPFFDLERVEVLRGPQGILFGKNSVASALNLSTARPDYSVEIALSTYYEFENDQQEFNGAFSGPLTENFRARLAFRSNDEDGFITNSYRGSEEPERDEKAARLWLE
jgi:iron complex outermembrane receptor protein